MKQVVSGMWVTHYGRAGVIDNVNDEGYAVVRFSNSPYPFPERIVVRVSELKRFKRPKKIVDDHEPAPF